MHAPSGIYPLPVEFWLTFPKREVLTCYEFGMLILEKVAPKQFHDKEMEGLRTFYPGNIGEDMLERMVFKLWLELWLKHLKWYIKAVSDYSLPLQYPLSPPLVPLMETPYNLKFFVEAGIETRKVGLSRTPAHSLKPAHYQAQVQPFPLQELRKVAAREEANDPWNLTSWI
ncbi:hypothetical protein QYF36_010349 [Acer negundo]|nr:hypothetical protein QYF36_010349 [Acer negundo]